MTLEVFSSGTAHRWAETLARFPARTRSLYHSPAYVLSWQDYEGLAPLCLHLHLEGVRFLYAFYRKPLPGAQASGPCDIQSPYGHGGLVCDDPEPDPALLARANAAIDAWCLESGVVAEFVRDYPGRPPLRDTRRIHVRENLFHRYGPQGLAASIKKRARRDVEAARKRGCEATLTPGLEGLERFAPLYEGLCRAKGIQDSHGFGAAYFEGVRRWLSRESLLVEIRCRDELVAACLGFLDGPELIYHLSASLPQGKALLANDLLLFTLLRAGEEAGCEAAFLGGGLGRGADDSLFRFKEKYATHASPMHIGTKVHDRAGYQAACEAWERANPDKAAAYGHFFLKYRM